MSTKAEIGRSPIASSRRRSQSGLAPLRTPRIWRPRNSGQADRSSISMPIGERKRPGTGVASSGFSVPSPDAARSRAMPRTPRQSARFGVTLMSMTGVAEPDQVGVPGSDRRVRRRFDDAVMIVAEAELIGRAQHAARGDAADHAFLEHRAGARDDRAGRGEDAFHAGARVGRAADHLHLFLAGVDHADPEPVRVRMALGRNHRGDGEGFEPGGAVLDRVDIVAEHDQPLDDRRQRRVGVEMGLEPAQGRLHAAAPPLSGPRTIEGMSSGRNP